jgi:hypothetical protein
MAAGLIALLLILFPLICGCLQIEPEELPPQTVPALPVVTSISPTVPVNTTVAERTAPLPINITSPRETSIFSTMSYPAEVKDAVRDYADGRTAESINGFLRWESVRARTNQAETARIREQIRRIDYALVNTTIKEDIRVYIGISGEQAKRIRNNSVFSENGYIIASYDPTVLYHRLSNTGRDKEGYLTLCAFDFRKGDHILFVNTTDREFLLPHGGSWDFAGEEIYGQLEFSGDSIPHYDDIIPTKVRIISTNEHP